MLGFLAAFLFYGRIPPQHAWPRATRFACDWYLRQKKRKRLVPATKKEKNPPKKRKIRDIFVPRWNAGLQDDTLLQCMPAPKPVEGECTALLVASAMLIALTLGWAVALAMPWSVHKTAHQYAPYAMAASWCLSFTCTIAAHWARWSRNGSTLFLSGLRLDDVPVWRCARASRLGYDDSIVPYSFPRPP